MLNHIIGLSRHKSEFALNYSLYNGNIKCKKDQRISEKHFWMIIFCVNVFFYVNNIKFARHSWEKTLKFARQNAMIWFICKIWKTQSFK